MFVAAGAETLAAGLHLHDLLHQAKVAYNSTPENEFKDNKNFNLP